MNPTARSLALAAALAGIATTFSSTPLRAERTDEQRALADALVVQVRETSRSNALSNRAKATLVADSVKAALAAALAGVTDWDSLVDSAAYFTVRAIQAAPELQEDIIAACLSVPRIASRPELAKAVESAIRQRLSSSPEEAEPSRGNQRPAVRPILQFSGSRSEAVVSPASLPTPTPTPVKSSKS